MTGYGSGAVGGFKVEIRSFNHRNLDIRVNVPSSLYSYEPEIRNLIKEKFHRGHIEIFVPEAGGDNIRLRINKHLAKEYYQALVSLKDELSIPDNVGINVLALQKDIFSVEESEVDISIFREALQAALNDLKKMQMEEGKKLADDIMKRIHFLNTHVPRIEDKRMGVITNAKTRLTEKLKDLLGNILIDDSRLIQEAAILVERTDITEEIVRIKSHLKHMEDVLRFGGAIGKKVDFFAQELHRELNTISSKGADAEISVLVIEMKHEVEKIREQIQNLQ